MLPYRPFQMKKQKSAQENQQTQQNKKETCVLIVHDPGTGLKKQIYDHMMHQKNSIRIPGGHPADLYHSGRQFDDTAKSHQ